MNKTDILEKVEAILCSCQSGITKANAEVDSGKSQFKEAFWNGKTRAYTEIVSQLYDLKTLLLGE